MKQAKWFLILHIFLGIYASSSVCSKLAARQPFLSVPFILLYGAMLLALVVYAFGWQQVIKHLRCENDLRTLSAGREVEGPVVHRGDRVGPRGRCLEIFLEDWVYHVIH